jgi:hypothetical protein
VAPPVIQENAAATKQARCDPWLKVARCQRARQLCRLALVFAVLGLLLALDVSTCVRYPEQDRNGTLAALWPLCVMAAGRAFGVWAGLVCCRWSPIGALFFGVAQVSAAGIAVAAAADPRAWSAVARFFTAGSVAALACVLAPLVVALLAGSYAIMRREPE